MTTRVLLLSPSRGLVGQIEHHPPALEWALTAVGVSPERLSLSRVGVRAHFQLLARGACS